jgi:tetratricopeptide (TPR) repeat protein
MDKDTINKLQRIFFYFLFVSIFILQNTAFAEEKQLVFVTFPRKDGKSDVIVGSAEDIMKDAEKFEKAGSYKDAQICYRAVIDQAPVNYHPTAHLMLGNIYRFNLGLPEEGIKEYEKAVAITQGPQESLIHRVIGETYLNDLNMPKEAIPELKKSLENNPENIQTIYNLAVAFSHNGNTEEGIIYFNKVIQLYPESDFAYVSQAQLFIFKEDYQSALDALNKAKQITTNEDLLKVIDNTIDAINKIQ